MIMIMKKTSQFSAMNVRHSMDDEHNPLGFSFTLFHYANQDGLGKPFFLRKPKLSILYPA